ncbi:metalloregulator ArsR/SmtB family transcription factor [Myceligenerans salitolerans]|uniref:Metalloregulator ArsR/SmtB family transcription factor n=1 Tax=Myceligenerans salitolerans TaxID=1230528 RepID=A0ABS3I928_9MICO|nr:metalloregulator ArsR/SmtB family transcription factor [Myceligenerans salitolerans]MBO0609513.1 metalloregulator ArsR/SmtB family transcription factor [Myceligenerans salitolerans]
MSIQDRAGVGGAAARHAIGPDAANAVAHTLKALADPLRLRMLSAIATDPDGETSAGELATLTDVAQPTVSHHLKVLRDVGLLASERRGTFVLYRIEPGYRGAITTLLDTFAPSAVGIRRPPHLTGLTDVDHELSSLAESLAARVPGATSEESLHVVRESYAALARRGGIPTHLVALTEHFARQRLDDLVKARERGDGTTAVRHPGAAHPPQVLFVCVANAGRSQLAAALMAHHAGDRVVVRSAGSAPAPDVHDTVRELLAEIDASGADDLVFPKPLTDDAVRAADVVITMGCGDACPVLPGKRYEDWVVGDPALASPAGVVAIRDELDRRVRALLAEIVPGAPVRIPDPSPARP